MTGRDPGLEPIRRAVIGDILKISVFIIGDVCLFVTLSSVNKHLEVLMR